MSWDLAAWSAAGVVEAQSSQGKKDIISHHYERGNDEWVRGWKGDTLLSS